MGMLCTGFVFGWTGPALPLLLAPDSPIKVTTDQIPIVASLVSFGSLPGAILCSLIIDRLGRKKPLLLTAIPYLVSYIILIYANNIWHLYISRLLSGFALGASFSLIPMYISEVTSPNVRGNLGSAIPIFLNTGILFQYCVGPFLNIAQSSVLYAAFAVLMFVCTLPIPESPYYLALINDYEGAEKSLRILRRKDDVEEELKEMMAGVKASKLEKQSAFQLLTNPICRKILWISFGMLTIQQLSGMGVILTYSQVIFESVKSPISADVSGVLLAVMNFVVTLLFSPIVDSFGRKTLISVSCVATMIPLLSLGGFFWLKEHNSPWVETFSLVPTLAIVSFKFTYGLGLAGLPFLVISELQPMNVKATLSSINSIIMTFVGYAALTLYQVLSDSFGMSTAFFVFAGFTVSGILFIRFCVPETRGKSLDEIQKLLHKE